MGFNGLFNTLFVIVGAYLLYQTIIMKKTGVIKSGWLVSPKINLNRSKDVTGYISYMFLRTIVFSIFLMVDGIFGFYSNYMNSIKLIYGIIILLSIPFFIWFMYCTTKATKIYLQPK